MAQGYYGTDSNPLAELHSERKVITPQTSGGSLEEGRYRLRTDLNSGDRIATYEINVGNGIEEAPVFPVSMSATSGIQKYRQTYVPGEGWGFVPVADDDNYHITYPQLQLYHDPSGAWYGWHDSLSAIPDSVDLHHQWDEGSGTLVADNIGSLDADFNSLSWGSDGDGLGGTYGILDGSNDEADLGAGSQSAFSHFIEGEGAFSIWLKPADVSSVQGIYTGGSGTGNNAIWRLFVTGSGTIRFSASDSSGSDIFDVSTGSTPTVDTWNYYGLALDGSDAVLIKNGSQVDSDPLANTESADLARNVYVGTDQSTSGRYYGGGIDDAWKDPTATSAQTLIDHYNATSGRYS